MPAASSQLDIGQTQMMPDRPLEPPPLTPLQHAIAIVSGSQEGLSQEVNRILGRRLKVASLILFAGFAAFLIKRLLAPSRLSDNSYLLIMHVCVTFVTGLIGWRLCVRCAHFINHLRLSELAVFGASALFFASLGYHALLETATDGYIVNIAQPWLILIFTYALFIPNSGRRALAFIGPMAIAPIVVLGLATATSPQVRDLIVENPKFQMAFLELAMVMTLGSTLAIWGVRMIRSLRTEAYEARQFGQYQLKRLLGRGGMGEVHLAEHVLLKRPCAIKLIRQEKAGNEESLVRFQREVQMTARLTHHNTIEIFDYGQTEEGTFYYVMEYLPGMNLDQLVEEFGPLSAGRCIALLEQTCDALAEAHQLGLVHRDIKPANIFAAIRGGYHDVAKLLDFGLVLSAVNEVDSKLTQEGTITGSPLYMSPEQARGDQPDARSDIYSLGCVAYYLLTGVPPFHESTSVKMILAHAQQTPLPLRERRAEIPEDLSAVIMRCLEKDPAARFASVDELRDALLNCQDSGTWTRSLANDWWQHYGCPKKKLLDACILAGANVEELTV